MQIPAKADYAIRALLALAANGGSVSAEHLAQLQNLPAKFLGSVLSDLRRGGILTSQRGPEGGFRLVRDPDAIMIADILRAVSGPLAGVRGMRPETLEYQGEATHLQDVWIAVRAALREVLEHVTLGRFCEENSQKVSPGSPRTRTRGPHTEASDGPLFKGGEGESGAYFDFEQYRWYPVRDERVG